MDKQIAYSFDKITQSKILKGLLIAMTGGAALAGLNYIGTIEIDNAFLASWIAIMVPFLVNAVKEFIKGF